MLDFRLDMLKERARAPDIQSLQTVADPQDGFAHVVRILQEQFIGGIAQWIGRRGFCMTFLAIFLRVYIRFAARKQNGRALIDAAGNFECSAILLPGSKADVDPQKYGEERHECSAILLPGSKAEWPSTH